MSVNLRIKKEEYTTIGDFLMQSFVRDQNALLVRFPKLNVAYMTAFANKLQEVKTLETGLVLTIDQKNATKALYDEIAIVNKELNFLGFYIANAGLNKDMITNLKRDLKLGNVEASILKLEGLKQYVEANEAILVAEGMAAGFANTLSDHKISIEAKNALQNNVMNARKALTETNKAQYNELYDYIIMVVTASKLLFDNTITKDEYTITKIISKLRPSR